MAVDQPSKFQQDLKIILNEIAQLLIDKNRKYGNSALEPIRIMSKLDASEQILIRIDDKLSRLKNQQPDDDEDAIQDLIGYLILYKMSKMKSQ